MVFMNERTLIFKKIIRESSNISFIEIYIPTHYFLLAKEYTNI